jgi:hypothetical protein
LLCGTRNTTLTTKICGGQGSELANGKHWPLFISQPVIPLFLYFYPSLWVVCTLAFVTFAWWVLVAPRAPPTAAVDLFVYFVWLRFAMSPLMAYWLWQSSRPLTAALALLWPLVGSWMILSLLMLPQAVLASTAGAKAAQIRLIQERLMSRFGYSHIRGVGYIPEGAARPSEQ